MNKHKQVVVVMVLTALAAPLHARFLQTDPVGYKDDLNLYAYVGNDPLNSVDPTGTICIRGINFSSAMCVRSMMYERTDADPAISSKTRFLGAAAIVTSALAFPEPSRFMQNLSATLETANMARADQIRSGQLYSSGSVQDNDRDFIHFEQDLVQKALDGFRASDRAGYEEFIGRTNSRLNNPGVGLAARGSDPNFGKALAIAKEKLGGSIDFSNQQHRETLGQAVADVASSVKAVCTPTGSRIARSC